MSAAATGEITDTNGATPVALLRTHPDLLQTVAQLLWAAAPEAQLMHDDPDDGGLVPLYLRAPLSEPQQAAFERGLDALLAEPSERRRGTYLREVRDLRGRRRELGVPVAPGDWRGGAVLVGPFPDEAAADAWRERTVAPPWLGDPLPHAGAWYVDVFHGEGEALSAAAR